MSTNDTAAELVSRWSCDERQRDATKCRNPYGCHCREITAQAARIAELERERKELIDMALQFNDDLVGKRLRALTQKESSDGR